MKVLIVEDEMPAARRLKTMLETLVDDIEILGVIDSVEHAINWFRTFPQPDLLLLDIQLADGISFDIFERVDLECPIIFTTAYDQYTLDAFKVNSIDYLLKPIDKKDLEFALDKFRRLGHRNISVDYAEIRKMLTNLQYTDNYRKRFLVKRGQHLIHIPVDETACFYSEDGISFLLHKAGQRYPVEHSIDELQQHLDPDRFFRVNRKHLIHVDAIRKIHKYFNGRLMLDLNPDLKDDVIVSRDRVKAFKKWLDR